MSDPKKPDDRVPDMRNSDLRDADPRNDYPLSEKQPDTVKSPSGIPLRHITLERLRDGGIGSDDLRITSEALKKQADISEASNQPFLAGNLRRAAELTDIPNDVLLEVYNAMRPHRSTRQELEHLCLMLTERYKATETADFIRSAVSVYEQKQLFRRNPGER